MELQFISLLARYVQKTCSDSFLSYSFASRFKLSNFHYQPYISACNIYCIHIFPASLVVLVHTAIQQRHIDTGPLLQGEVDLAIPRLRGVRSALQPIG